MASEPRKPPRNLALHLRRVLGGRAGWGGFVAQLAFVAFVIWLGYEIYSNAQANLRAQRIATGFGFLQQTAGFATSQFGDNRPRPMMRPRIVAKNMPITDTSSVFSRPTMKTRI